MKRLMRKLVRWLRDQLSEGSGASSWTQAAPYVRLGECVILGAGSNVDVKYSPESPGVCVEIGDESQIFGTLVVQRPGATIRVGKRTQIGASMLIAACGIDVGDDVMMAWDITLMDNDSHSIVWDERANDVRQCAKDYAAHPSDFARNKDWSNVPMAPIKIGSKAWIGFGVSILKGVTVGEGAVIGAGSVVTSDVAPYTVVAGNPARQVRTLEQNG